MFKTIFGKLMLLFVVILLVSLYASGIMMSQQIRQTYLSDSGDMLAGVASDVANMVKLYHDGELTFEQMEEGVGRKATVENDIIWVLLSDGKLISAGRLPASAGEVTPAQIRLYYGDMMETMDAEGTPVKTTAESGSLLGTPAITVGMAMPPQNGMPEYVFVNMQVSALNTTLRTVYRQIMLSVAIAALLATLLTYFFTRNMLRPLSIVSMGANQLSRGNFDVALEVHSKDEIGQLARSFNVLATDLKKYQQTRDSFVANVSHELRSPLTSMQGLLAGVMDGTIPPEQAAHYLDVVLGETKRLNMLINDLLDLAKMESGQFPIDLEKVDINEILRRVLLTFESKIDAKNLEVEVEFQNDREPVYADENRIYQVAQNLMDNAIKFAGRGGRLRIATAQANGHVLVSINNSGEPIPGEVVPYLFDRFYKADEGRSRAVEGTGIGLSIVKKILEEHRQRIWVESDGASGTTFTFTLKRA